ncbi:hypothetical protein MNBD_GAMMA01-1323 [hydrothermal vent metagenome]|uniref:Uncharacterized protein n=1 Tax=hydrothermal vent metagenome TaxID=652676 RepID=A0A3B0VF70_9ZZZZ
MARFIKQGTARNDDGDGIVAGATITVYLAGGTTGAVIYTTSSGGTAIAGSLVTTDANGHYYFYVDSEDYPGRQLFRLKLSILGATDKFYDDVDIILDWLDPVPPSA